MTTTTTDVATIPTLEHDEAMVLAATEYNRFLDVLRALAADDWRQPTDCPLWDVRQLVAHNLGNIEAAASVRNFAALQVRATRRAKREGIPQLDAMTAVQVDERASLTPKELVDGLTRMSPKAVAGRRRAPALLRTKVRIPMGDDGPKRPLGFLLDAVFTRDVWMHRVDVSRATGRPMQLTADHDGRLVADIVAEWAGAHGRPFTLVLTGESGGIYVARGDAGAEPIELDAVEFCRILSGRAAGVGLLTTQVPF